MYDKSHKLTHTLFSRAVIIFCILLMLFSMGCSKDEADKPASGTQTTPAATATAGTEEDYKKLYAEANDNFDKKQNVGIDIIGSIVISVGDVTLSTILRSNIYENNRNTEQYQFSDSTIIAIGSADAIVSEVTYIDGIFYQKNDGTKVAYEMTHDEFKSYMSDGYDELYGQDSVENVYDIFTGEKTVLGTEIQYSGCDKESSYLKGEVISALLLCGIEVLPEDVTILESSGNVVISDEKNIAKEDNSIKAQIVIGSETAVIDIEMDINIVDYKENMIVAPDINEYKILPHPDFAQNLTDLYVNLVEKNRFELTSENEVKFVVNNTSATFTDENIIEYVNNDEELSFDIDYEQTIKCSKLSPKTTTNTITENFSTKTGKYVAYENKTKVSEQEADAYDAVEYIYQQLLYLVPDYMLFETIATSTAEDGSITTYTFDLADDYINAYCAYYITYYDSSLSAYPYDSTVVEAAEGELIIIADAAEGVIRDVMINMSCKYNYQSKYTISFTYSGSIECTLVNE